MSHSPRQVPRGESPLRTVSFPTFVDATLHKKLHEVSVGHAKMAHAKMEHAKMGHAKTGPAKTGPAKMKHAKMGHAKMGHAKMGRSKKSQKEKSSENLGRPSTRTIERQPPQSPRLASVGDDFGNCDSVDKSSSSTGSETMELFSSSSRPMYGPVEAFIPVRAMERRQESPERVSSRSKSVHALDEVMKRERARLILKYARATLRTTTAPRLVSPPFTPFRPRPAINLPSVQAQKKSFGPAKRVTLDGLPILTKSAGVRAGRRRRRPANEVTARAKPKLILRRPDTLTEGSSPSPIQTDVALQAMAGTGTFSGSADQGDEWLGLESQPTLETEVPEDYSKQWIDGLASCWKSRPSRLKTCAADGDARLDLESTHENEDGGDHYTQWRERLASCWKDKPENPRTSSLEPVDERPVLESRPTFETEDLKAGPKIRFAKASSSTASDASTAEFPPAKDSSSTIIESQSTLEIEDSESTPMTRFSEASDSTESDANTAEFPPARDAPPAILESQPTFEIEDLESISMTQFVEASDSTDSDASTAEFSPARDSPPTILDSLFEGTQIWSDEDSLSVKAQPSTQQSLETRGSDPKPRRRKLVKRMTGQTGAAVKKEKFDWMKRDRSQPSGEENIDPRLKNHSFGSMRALPVVDGKFRAFKRVDKGSWSRTECLGGFEACLCYALYTLGFPSNSGRIIGWVESLEQHPSRARLRFWSGQVAANHMNTDKLFMQLIFLSPSDTVVLCAFLRPDTASSPLSRRSPAHYTDEILPPLVMPNQQDLPPLRLPFHSPSPDFPEIRFLSRASTLPPFPRPQAIYSTS